MRDGNDLMQMMGEEVTERDEHEGEAVRHGNETPGDSSRDRFGALETVPDWVTALVRQVEVAGVFRTGIASDKRGRGSGVNVEVYGHDGDQHLAVIQVRQCTFRPNRYNHVRKDYYLIGRLETGAPFAHPIVSPARSPKALTTPEACVRYVQTKLWGCDDEDLSGIVRQGDVALVPARLPRDAEPMADGEIILAGSLPGEHSHVRHVSGIRRVVVAPRASTWGFTAPSED